MRDNQKDPNHPGPLAPQPQPTNNGTSSKTIEEIASALRDLFNRVPGSVNDAGERRDMTVTVKLNEASSDALDLLVLADMFKARAEAAAFLINEGIKAQAELFQRIQDSFGRIEGIRRELRTGVASESQS